jgi:hypothetical protein
MSDMLAYIASTGCSSGVECCFREAEVKGSNPFIPICLTALLNKSHEKYDCNLCIPIFVLHSDDRLFEYSKIGIKDISYLLNELLLIPSFQEIHCLLSNATNSSSLGYLKIFRDALDCLPFWLMSKTTNSKYPNRLDLT